MRVCECRYLADSNKSASGVYTCKKAQNENTRTNVKVESLKLQKHLNSVSAVVCHLSGRTVWLI